jgi:hypothetical protein
MGCLYLGQDSGMSMSHDFLSGQGCDRKGWLYLDQERGVSVRAGYI